MISMKKTISWILTIILMLSMSACNTGNTETTMPPTIDHPGNSGPSKPTMKEPPKLTVSFGPGDSFDAATGTYGLFRDLAAPFGVAVLVPFFTNSITGYTAKGVTAADAAVRAIRTLGIIEIICVAAGILVVLMLPRIHHERRDQHAAER